MNNYLLIILIACMGILLPGCRSRQQTSGQSRAIRYNDTTKVTVANAYNDDFLDSVTLERFLNAEVKPDSLAGYMRRFYSSRGYSFAWFDEGGLSVQAQGFWDSHKMANSHGGITDSADGLFHMLVDSLLSDSAYVLPQAELVNTELRFTKHFFRYISATYGTRFDPEEAKWHIPRRKLSPETIADSLFASDTGEWAPFGEPFRLLRGQIAKYRRAEQQGGWATIKADKGMTLKPGDNSKLVPLVRQRLRATGDSTLADDTGNVYTDDLRAVILKQQEAFGLPANGIIDASLLTALNVPVQERLRQMLINLERMKWMPQLPKTYLLANIPEYRLHVIVDGKEALGMNIVVGKAANRTVIFSDELKYIVFSPYWNVPRSIVRNEIYPAMQRNASYLRRHNMEVTGHSGGLPVVRQLPGGSNALGHVKFLFPNSYNIYFHDTPSKGLFDKKSRAFSHGCVRLEKPAELAALLLRDKPEWTNEKISEAMNRKAEKWVTLDKPVPVFITYFTAWVDDAGVVHFAPDVYGHDKSMATHMFE